MKLLRKFVTFIICISIAISLMPCALATDAVNYDDVIDRMTSLNIIPEKVTPNNFVSRKELAKYVCYMLNLNSGIFPSENKFFDVADDEYNGFIGVVSGMGIMIGTGDGIFSPDELVTAEIAAKVLINAVGYSVFLNEINLNSYWNYAVRNKITTGIRCNQKDYIKAGELAQIIWNILDLNAIELDGKTDSSRKIGNEKMLHYYFDISTGYGQVTANDKTGLKNDNKLNAGCIAIDDVFYTAGTDYISDMLGKKIRYYKKSCNDFEYDIILWAEVKDSKSYKVDSKNITEVTRNKFQFSENGKTKNIKLSPVLNVIYNGTYLANFKIEDLNPAIGNVELIDAEDDGTFDTAIIKSYIPYVVNGIDFENRIIYDKINYQNVNIRDEADVRIVYQNKIMNLSEIEEDDILLIASDKYLIESGKKIIDSDKSEKYEILLSKNKISGKASEIDYNEKTIKINELSYGIPNEYNPEKYFKVGNEAVFYIDSMENVVYATIGSSAGRKTNGTYGYLTKVIQNENDDDVMIRIFDEYSVWNTYELSDTVQIDGISAKSSDNKYTLLTMENDAKLQGGSGGQLITYILDNDGKVKQIDTARVSEKEDAEKTNKISMPITYAQYYYEVFERKFAIDTTGNNILIVPMLSPSGTEYDASNEREYMWIKSNFADGARYYMQAYNADDYCKAEKFVYLKDPKGSPTSDDLPVIISNKITALNTEGDVVIRLTVIGRNGTATLDVDNSTVIMELDDTSKKLSVNDLNVGDILNYSENNGKISSINKLFSIYDAEGQITPYASEYGGNSYVSSMNMVWGNLYAMNSDSVNILCSDDENEKEQLFVYNTSGVKVICYDLVDSGHVTQIACADAKDFLKTRDISECYKIFINCKYGVCNSIFVYRVK